MTNAGIARQTAPMMRDEYLTCLGMHGLHRLHYTDWGDANNPHIVICAHGYTRNARDFDFLARALENDFRVLCPDMVGHGASDSLPVKEDYGYPQYLADINTLLARLMLAPMISSFQNIFRQHEPQTIDWVGTSMGGILGMMLAAQPRSPIRRLVINDVGPEISHAALAKIGEYVTHDQTFATRDELAAHLRKIGASFGALTDAQWEHLTLHSSKQLNDGRWRLNYDPGIGAGFRYAAPQDLNFWALWDLIHCKTLVLRGGNSELLSADLVARMQQRGPHPQVITFADIGHAPMLMANDQIHTIKNFLRAP